MSSANMIFLANLISQQTLGSVVIVYSSFCMFFLIYLFQMSQIEITYRYQCLSFLLCRPLMKLHKSLRGVKGPEEENPSLGETEIRAGFSEQVCREKRVFLLVKGGMTCRLAHASTRTRTCCHSPWLTRCWSDTVSSLMMMCRQQSSMRAHNHTLKSQRHQESETFPASLNRVGAALESFFFKT